MVHLGLYGIDEAGSGISGKYDDDWRDTDGGYGADSGHSGGTEGKASSLGVDYEAFGKQKKLPGEL